jgi:hypothetical protein
MPSVTSRSELPAIIDDLKHRLLSAQVSGVRITPQSEGLTVGGHIVGQQTAAAIRRCCDEVSRQYGIDIFVSCTMF